MPHYSAKLIKSHPSLAARVMEISTPHGKTLTPSFMPVGTKAVLNYVTPADLIASQVGMILGGNTYHMLCTPGLDIIQQMGGMHRFMSWQYPMLTDSGGFQVWSLSKKGNICVIDEKGAHFKHPITSAIIHLTPETSIEAQKVIGADIIMAFDQCTPEEGGRDMAMAALKRTHEWLIRSKERHVQNPYSAYGNYQALFGIVQGGRFRDLREKSALFILQQDLDGIAIGGEVIGYDMNKTGEILDWLWPMLPAHQIRYTMGVGLMPQDLIDVVAKGVDIFDCVAPTRNARHGTLYCGKFIREKDWLFFQGEEHHGRLHIKKKQYANDEKPLIANCTCYTCLHFTRAYLHYLFKEKLIAYFHLACIHNIHVMQQACIEMQNLIMNF